MAEPLKNSFGPEVATRVAEKIESVLRDFDRASFLEVALDGYDDLELTDRAKRISDALAATLPGNRTRAIEIVTESLGPDIGEAELTGLGSFVYLPMVYFVAEHGLDCFETSMLAQYELTKRFTAEFSIRAFLERYPVESLERLAKWARDPNVHVRRLVSEGTRPRLPWARRLRGFQRDPAPVLELLEVLKDDPEEYVRRSVANNLNDISKDHPELVVEVATAWWTGAGPERKKLVRHALRALVKAGDPGALEVLGYGPDSPVQVRSVLCEPEEVAIGGKVRITAELLNPTDREAAALVDLRVHFVKKSGATSPKVFKGAELALGPAQAATVRKTISVAQHTTRKHYPGEHRVELLLNGVTHPGAAFEVV